MASNHKREEIHKAIWSIADDLRGSVDGWDFKQYVLGIMFYRYISENITNYINEGERKAGDTTFDYAKLKDSDAKLERDNLVKEKGFFILPSELFCNVVKKAKDDENLNEIETKKFLDNSFRGGQVKTIGTDIEKILPPMGRFNGDNRNERKQAIIEKVLKFFDKYFGLGI
ncbi:MULTISPECIES: type I restriction endonuclease subunit R, EcoR124 family [Campylobacter]|uniref:type I restriction endonuclease subunit R, EcoR124 family n=1 Tax=Campylobacter TaxID=194 RepID=UPI000A33AD7D|nr:MULTISPECIES: type I restriction-modification system subunit M N-terminal domain-containing protein [unclassified Campylobacter]MCR8696858.1 type I restriction-modification system subunit M N-terminal domain-containing protein [Campylobacter sp. RM19073]